MNHILKFSALVLVALVGCGDAGPPTGTFSGQVMLGDKPYSNPAEIAVMSMETGYAATAPLSEEGKFSFTDPMVVGEYTAYLTPAQTPAESPDQPMSVTIDQSVPSEYWNESSSPLKVTISEGENTETLEIPK